MEYGTAIFLCDVTGIAAEPWAEAGYECFCVDIQHSIRRPRFAKRGAGVIHFVWGDARSWKPVTPISFLMGFPPCTNTANSGARDFKTKGPAMLADAVTLFNACDVQAAYSGAPYCLENPSGVLSSHIRKPDYTFDPCDYAGYLSDPSADAYTKKTCLWTGGGFVMPPVKRVEPVLGSKMHRLPPSDDREAIRSATPRGFARAVFESNCRMVRSVSA